MRIPTSRRGNQILRALLLITAVIHTLLVSGPLPASAAEMLVAQLNADIHLTEGGRAIRSEGPRLATVAGNALLSPAMPVTLRSEAPLHRVVLAKKETVRTRVRVPSGATFRVVVTAYSSTRDQTDASPFITASGTHVHDGTLAANFLPIGTKVTFPKYSGDKVYIVEDRTNPKYSSRVDIWFPTRAAALQFGKRTLTMIVVE